MGGVLDDHWNAGIADRHCCTTAPKHFVEYKQAVQENLDYLIDFGLVIIVWDNFDCEAVQWNFDGA